MARKAAIASRRAGRGAGKAVVSATPEWMPGGPRGSGTVPGSLRGLLVLCSATALSPPPSHGVADIEPERDGDGDHRTSRPPNRRSPRQKAPFCERAVQAI